VFVLLSAGTSRLSIAHRRSWYLFAFFKFYFIDLFIYLFIYLFVYWFICLFVNSFIMVPVQAADQRRDLLREILEVKRTAKEEADGYKRTLERDMARVRDHNSILYILFHEPVFIHFVSPRRPQVRDDAQRTVDGLRAELTDVQAALADAQKRLSNRESRPEDMALVEQLKGLIIQQQALIAKQENEMKFFKLELMNREENFNRRFGSQVGGAKSRLLG
jgi:hypothetical protein